VRGIPALLFLIPCAIAANPPVTFTFSVGTTCTDCLSGEFQINALTTDAAGNTYLTGSVNTSAFPATPNAFQTTLTPSECVGPPTFLPPCSDAFAVKLDPYGNIVWATYVGGNGNDSGTAIAVDVNGNVFVAGTTWPDHGFDLNTFPVAAGAPFGPPPARDGAAFITELSADGSRLIYSTFLPGGAYSSLVAAMTIDSSGNAYVAYQSDPALTIPTTPGAFQSSPQNVGGPGVVVKLNASGSALAYATYLSGSGPRGTQDSPLSIAVDAAGNAVIAGITGGTSFPVTAGAWQTADPDPGAATGFVSKLNAGGTALIYSTYFGFGASAVKLDSSGNAYVLGQISNGSNPTALAEVSADGSSLVYLAPVPGAASIDLDPIGNAYVVGTNPAAAATVFVERFAPNGVLSGMQTLGGPPVYAPGALYPINDSANAIAIAPNGSVVISGIAVSGNFPGISQAVASEGMAYLTSFFITATVMNAANYVPGVVAPGEIITILGDGFGGGITNVDFDGFGAPVLYLSGRQINAQVPWEIAGQSSTRLSITETLGPMDSMTIGPFVVAVAPSVPGVFYVTNSDGSINSAGNPAARGDFVTIYGTGGGLTSPAGTTGGFWPLSPLASLTLPISITIGGVDAGLIFSGSAPTLLSGFFQVNVRVPQNLTPSASAPMVLNIGTARTTVSVAIK
jgi:uncharacterized protein (TIGR03437 family)